ncbi:DUF3325 domain-containing protein [uncultured Halopseudomonas sp.]|uniref:DUF3325 domain-containing protein n=1 Tax=uncultured Halopseudomonas sp. TaxID=2901193 RepID=UPI0030EBD3E4|tara:strand:+ start:21375 stop:21710 length:336 start_codon:yes stop_codon:yes gene_type:complete
MNWPGVAVLLLAHAGFSFKALAMDKHRRHLLHDRSLFWQHSRVVELGGWLSLGAALLVSLKGYGAGVGLILLFGILSMAALAVILQVSYRPKSVKLVSLFSLGSGITGLLW